MTLWLVLVIPTRLPADSSEQIIRAAVKVLPEPGGPWIARVVWSRASARRRAAARSRFVGPAQIVVEPLADPRRQAEQQVASRAGRPGRLDPVIRDPLPRGRTGPPGGRSSGRS